ncbi:hypothetical protein DFH08DRAFT_151917 [Mycena albidolilacea]|uniref:Uncharacterized protein n=1 Tax=Mycena albidolilacea TaxID=1033008 RepID=A0AAD7E691_9AGAR|nr:hypothetical protein DFH08DRAFT_151917 [Mycena albidolilacea]
MSDTQASSLIETELPVSKSTLGQPPIYILWAGKATTCQGFAEKVSQEAKSNGFEPFKIKLSKAVGADKRQHLKDGPVVILTCTYDGKPVVDAVDFYGGLVELKEQGWQDITYAVFGYGANVFEATHQLVPKKINELIAERGGQRFLELGEGDVGVFLYDTWEEWRERMWDAARCKYSTEKHDVHLPKFDVEETDITERHKTLNQSNVKLAEVVENRPLTAPGFSPESRHMELRFREDLQYKPGDVVSILSHNAYADVRKVMKRLGKHPLQEIVIKADFAWMHKDRSILLADLLTKYVDLRYPATRANIRTLLQHVPKTDETKATRHALANWSEPTGPGKKLAEKLAEKLWDKFITVTDLLEEYPDIKLPLNEFLRMLQPMRARNYSISSSALVDPRRLTLTYRVHDFGVCSQFLARLQKGDSLYLLVDPSAHKFHLPDRLDIPLIMFATGTGIAPLRGMLEHCAEMRKKKEEQGTHIEIGKTLLFFGCESRKSYLYGDSDLKKWEDYGIVSLRPAFSWEASKVYVQDRLWEDRAEVVNAYKDAVKLMSGPSERVILGCGHRQAAQSVMEKCVDIVVEYIEDIKPGLGILLPKEKKEKKALATQIVNQYRNLLYVTDVF